MMRIKKSKYKYLSVVPTLALRPNFFLIHVLSSTRNFHEFEENLKSFSEILKTYGSRILKEISKVFGCEWKEKDIFIYPLPEKVRIPSTAFPLLLRIRANQQLNLYFLTHELVHRFIETNQKLLKRVKKITGEERGIKMEAFVVFVTQKIFSKMFGSVNAGKMRKLEKQIVRSRDERKVDSLIEANKEKFEKLLRS